jgi:hypothetical protein
MPEGTKKTHRKPQSGLSAIWQESNRMLQNISLAVAGNLLIQIIVS